MSAAEPLSATLAPTHMAWIPGLFHRVSVTCRHYRLTAFLSAIAIMAYACPALTTAMQLDFACVDAGQWWRLLTGHLTHFGGGHLFWDLLMFVVLSAACEGQHPRLYGILLIVMTLGISATIVLQCNDVTVYRGLSGIDTGLFVWFIADQTRQSLAVGDRTLASFWTATGTLLVGKLLYELATGEILFVDAEGFKPLVESHLSGAVLGAMCAGVGIVSVEVKLPSDRFARMDD